MCVVVLGVVMEVKKEAWYEGDADAPSSSFFVTTVRFGFDDDDD